MKDTTFIIKTLERPDCLARLMSSLRQYYPRTPVMVGDDSRDPGPAMMACSRYEALRFVQFDFDIGLSAGRNALVDLVETEFVVTLDDDFIFLPQTRIELLTDLLVSHADICGGQVLNTGQRSPFQGFMDLIPHPEKEGWFRLRLKHKPVHQDPVRVDIIPNFFAARTETLRRCPWREELKVSEHHAFFLDAKAKGLRVMMEPRVVIDHISDSNQTYANIARYRRPGECWDRFCEAFKIVDVIGGLVGGGA